MASRITTALRVLFNREQPTPALRAIMGGSTVAGVHVDEMTALGSPAVYAAVRVLSESIASLPLITYRRAGDNKERAIDHALYRLLHDAPNSEMTSFEWREAMAAHLLLWGNAYTEIELNKRGDVIGLWPMPPHRVTPMRSEGGTLYYRYQRPDNVFIDMPASKIMHIRGLGYDGLVGYSPVAIARQTIGAALAIDRYGASFFGNGARPGVALEHPGRLSEPALKKLRESWNDAHQGVDNAHRVAVLEEGMKLTTYSTSPEDAQFLQTRQFQLSEIARIFRVPPHMIGDLSRATFSNIEHQSLDFVTHSLRPWLVRIEQAIQRDLVGPIEGSSVYVEFLVEGMLRGDQKSRYEAYAIAKQWGWLSSNDIRKIENMNSIGKQGDVYLIPLNMVTAKTMGAPPEKAEPKTSDDKQDDEPKSKASDKTKREVSLAPLILDARARITKRAQQDGARAREQQGAHFLVWWLQYREKVLKRYVESVCAPIADAFDLSLDELVADALGEVDQLVA